MSDTYIIGEIGQNHNGSVDIAKLIIELAARSPVDEIFGTTLKPMSAIKLTKRDLDYELTESANIKPYTGPNSFGETYGEHRKFLELDDHQHYDIYQYAKENNLEFVETLCAPSCLSLLKLFSPDRLKVASRDLTNLPLLEVMAETKIPIILSTGMAGQKELDRALDTISKHHNSISILHCLSQYPAEHTRINLNSIHFLKERYPQYEIGYSDHSIGISIPVSAVAMGARVIEKHITIDRDMKGSDQKGSLGPDGVKRMVRDIRIVEQALGKKEMFIDDSIKQTRKKLERSVASKVNIQPGELIDESNIHLLSPGDGVRWQDRNELIGKKAKALIPKNEIIYTTLVE